jgi:GMP synthase (glutamine-hydrolysing)
MTSLHLLVADGNSALVRERQMARTGATFGIGFAALLQMLAPDCKIAICCPADADAVLPAGGFAAYDGVVLTGSLLSAYEDRPEVRRQIAFLRAAADAALPVFGSCWGLQLAAVSFGGAVARSAKGGEIGFARKITLTQAGRAHPLHAGRGPAYDAPAVHNDEVTAVPPGTMVTASNSISAVQGAEIPLGPKSTFWGVQYHPEFSLGDMANVVRRSRHDMINDGRVRDEDEAARIADDLATLQTARDRTDLAWRYGLDADVLDDAVRSREVANWLASLTPRR